MAKYVELFTEALENGASDDVLNGIIEDAAENIENNKDYVEFYEIAMELYSAF